MKVKTKKIARMVLRKDNEGNPVCIAVMKGFDEDLMWSFSKALWGKVHLFPCHIDMTVEQANKPIANDKMRNYGGF